MDFGTRNHRKSSSSDRFLGVFSTHLDSSVVKDSTFSSFEDELNEDDVFWTGDFAQNKSRKSPSLGVDELNKMVVTRSPFKKGDDSFGILAALTDESKVQALCRKSSFSPSVVKNVLAIPKPKEREGVVKKLDLPKYNCSAPVNVPILTKEMMKANARRNKAFFDVVDDDGDDEMLPPHEIVARGSALTPNTTFSMLEGAGRTLKGRDLRQVRNAVFRQTGFLD